MKRFPTLLVVRKLQHKTTVRYLDTYIKMAQIFQIYQQNQVMVRIKTTGILLIGKNNAKYGHLENRLAVS